jgi:hypothetical protein
VSRSGTHPLPIMCEADHLGSKSNQRANGSSSVNQTIRYCPRFSKQLGQAVDIESRGRQTRQNLSSAPLFITTYAQQFPDVLG